MDGGYLQRLTATIVLLGGLTAAVIVSTPGVSPIVATNQRNALLAVPGGVASALGVLALVALVAGSRLLSLIAVVLLPAVCVAIAEFATLVVPARPLMALVLLVLPPLVGHAMYTYGAADLREEPLTAEVMRGWHPWPRRAVSWLQDRSRQGWFGRLVTACITHEEKHPGTGTAVSMLAPVGGSALGVWLAIVLALVNAKPSNGVPLLSEVLFALTSALILFAAPTVAYLAVRAEQQERAATD